MVMNGDQQAVSLDEVLANIDTGYFHTRLWWVCGLGFAAAAIEVVVMAFVFPELRDAWKLDEYQLGTLASIVGLGSIIGECIWGAVADRIGRRPVFLMTVIVVVAAGIASACAPGPMVLCGTRFLVGFGYGGNIAVDFALLSEFLATEARGKHLFFVATFWPVGQLFTTLLAWSLIPHHGWRAFMACCALPSLLAAFSRPWIPESPRWLLTKGRVEEATQVLRDIAATNGKRPEEVGLPEGMQVTLANELSQLTGASGDDFYGGIMKLLSVDLWRTTLGVSIFVSALNFAGYGITTFMPSFLEMKGIPGRTIYATMTLNALSQFPGVFGSAALAPIYGRLTLIHVSLLCAGVSLLVFAYARDSVYVAICTCFASMFLESGWAIFHVYVPEAFPTELRASACGLLSATGSVFSMVAPFISAYFVERERPFYAILTFSAIVVSASVLTWNFLHIETTDRDLQDKIKSVPSWLKMSG
mmetsp:Transcript_44655/g.83216  ORF Transcript_44655/g.83216 Transcript_44655/m.83216 type:complete len:474 (-) Transcript_44655:94-1515(-)